MVEQRIGERIVRLTRGDITDMEVEAFVFDITPDMKLGSGFGGAIQQRGGIVIQKELDEIGSCPTGEAVVTQAGHAQGRSHHPRQRPQVPRGGRGGQAARARPSRAAAGRGEGYQAAGLPADRHRALPGAAGPLRASDGRHGHRAPEERDASRGGALRGHRTHGSSDRSKQKIEGGA